ncbi:hypothetical protein RRG08_030177 [Elysia crispata]|uniref:Uncharacterized protein n=1 Tax=Elysia crispata TaxID=231223 RepID=A0AAE0ZR68_9GAST|nr:hypothetical protein RRG08_030177 [Elysia crispata]
MGEKRTKWNPRGERGAGLGEQTFADNNPSIPLYRGAALGTKVNKVASEDPIWSFCHKPSLWFSCQASEIGSGQKQDFHGWGSLGEAVRTGE